MRGDAILAQLAGDCRRRDDRVMQVGQWDKNDGATVLALDQDRLYPGRELLRRLYPLGKGVSPSMSGNMFRRDMALALGGFDDFFAVCSRIRFSEPRSIYTARVFVSHEIFDRYRQHDESCFRVAKATGQSDGARRQFLLWLGQYLDKVDCRDPVVRMKLRRKMLRYDYPLIRRMWLSAVAWVQRVARKN